MRAVEFKPRAVVSIEAVCAFIESKNTPGSSFKWYTGLIQFVVNGAQTNKLRFPLCNYPKFAKKGYSCFVFKKEWVIVFRYSASKLVVERFVHGSRLA